MQFNVVALNVSKVIRNSVSILSIYKDYKDRDLLFRVDFYVAIHRWFTDVQCLVNQIIICNLSRYLNLTKILDSDIYDIKTKSAIHLELIMNLISMFA